MKLTAVDYNPFEVNQAAEPVLTPVDYDPFTTNAAPAPIPTDLMAGDSIDLGINTAPMAAQVIENPESFGDDYIPPASPEIFPRIQSTDINDLIDPGKRFREFDSYLTERAIPHGKPTPEMSASPVAKPDVGITDALKMLGAGATQATLGVSESVLRTPEAIQRHIENLTSALPEAPREFLNRGNPFATLSRGMEGTDFGGANVAADEVSNVQESLVESGDFPVYTRLAEKGQQADRAFKAAINGDTSRLGGVLTDPEAWAGFIGNSIPSLYAAYKSGGSPVFIAWLEGMETASSVADFEKSTGQSVSSQDFVKAQAQVMAINTWLEKFGLDKVLKVGKGNIVSSMLKGSTSEAGTEMLQEFNQNLSQKLSFDPDKELTTGLMAAGMGGGGVGAGASGMVSIANRAEQAQPIERMPPRTTVRPELNTQTFQQPTQQNEFAQQPRAVSDTAEVKLTPVDYDPFAVNNQSEAQQVKEQPVVNKDEVALNQKDEFELAVPEGAASKSVNVSDINDAVKSETNSGSYSVTVEKDETLNNVPVNKGSEYKYAFTEGDRKATATVSYIGTATEAYGVPAERGNDATHIVNVNLSGDVHGSVTQKLNFNPTFMSATELGNELKGWIEEELVNQQETQTKRNNISEDEKQKDVADLHATFAEQLDTSDKDSGTSNTTKSETAEVQNDEAPLPERWSAGAAAGKTTPITKKGGALYRETSPDNLRNLLLSNRQGDVEFIHVSKPMSFIYLNRFASKRFP